MKTELRTRTLSTDTGWTVAAEVIDRETRRILGQASACVYARADSDDRCDNANSAVLESVERRTVEIAIRRAQARGVQLSELRGSAVLPS